MIQQFGARVYMAVQTQINIVTSKTVNVLKVIRRVDQFLGITMEE